MLIDRLWLHCLPVPSEKKHARAAGSARSEPKKTKKKAAEDNAAAEDDAAPDAATALVSAVVSLASTNALKAVQAEAKAAREAAEAAAQVGGASKGQAERAAQAQGAANPGSLNYEQNPTKELEQILQRQAFEQRRRDVDHQNQLRCVLNYSTTVLHTVLTNGKQKSWNCHFVDCILFVFQPLAVTSMLETLGLQSRRLRKCRLY